MDETLGVIRQIVFAISYLLYSVLAHDAESQP